MREGKRWRRKRGNRERWDWRINRVGGAGEGEEEKVRGWVSGRSWKSVEVMRKCCRRWRKPGGEKSGDSEEEET